LQVFPQVLFAHSLSSGGVTIYARAPLPPEATQRIDETLALVRRSELAVPGRRERVFVCNSGWIYRLLCPGRTGAFAASMPITDNIFIADADLAVNVARRASSNYNTRSFSGVVAHEITHGLIRHKLGWLRSARLPDWVAEGYCEYVAREGSFPEAEGVRLLAAGRRHPNSAFRYFLFRQMVTHLMDDGGLSFAQVVARGREGSVVEADTVGAIRRKFGP